MEPRDTRRNCACLLVVDWVTQMWDIALMGKIGSRKTPQEPAEQGLQIRVEEAQMEALDELPEVVSSLSQIEQEDISEWGISDGESMVFKTQETLEVKPVDQSSKPLEDKEPEKGSKAAKRLSLKAEEWKEHVGVQIPHTTRRHEDIKSPLFLRHREKSIYFLSKPQKINLTPVIKVTGTINRHTTVTQPGDSLINKAGPALDYPLTNARTTTTITSRLRLQK
ncbi:uncharacterized protein LOC129145408 [Talpa occidentalis]|uniref:uncharacterized protein LOC129145408 n=1 Tax=Talpa occidentalis TaxID=50954 RepID=UPI0023F754AF|nr:uncharacterized protein LOC129145408 [Talpa occidentalis]